MLTEHKARLFEECNGQWFHVCSAGLQEFEETQASSILKVQFTTSSD
jgi:hypothetical protein